MNYERSDDALRGAILALKASTGWSSAEISTILGLSVRQVNRIYSRAVIAGFNPSARPLQITNLFVSDRARSGRPKKRNSDLELAIAAKVQKDRYGREKPVLIELER